MSGATHERAVSRGDTCIPTQKHAAAHREYSAHNRPQIERERARGKEDCSSTFTDNLWNEVQAERKISVNRMTGVEKEHQARLSLKVS